MKIETINMELLAACELAIKYVQKMVADNVQTALNPQVALDRIEKAIKHAKEANAQIDITNIITALEIAKKYAQEHYNVDLVRYYNDILTKLKGDE